MGPYPEEVILDPKYAVGGGYGESKYISERVPLLRYYFLLNLCIDPTSFT